MQPGLSKKQEKTLYWILIGFLAAFLGVCFFLKAFGISVRLPMCALLKWTGFYCPGCGGTRAVASLLRGNLWSSFCYHPIVPYGAFVVGWYLFSHTIEYISKGKYPIGMRYRDIYLYLAILILLINWIVKNACWIAGGIRLI